MTFPYLERYLSIRLGCDLTCIQPGQPCVVETPRRLCRERSYTYTRVCWWLQLGDGRAVISVPPGAGTAVRKLISEMPPSTRVGDPAVTEQLQTVINRILTHNERPPLDNVFTTLAFACTGALLRSYPGVACRRLTDRSLPTADVFAWPPYSFLDGVLYGVIADEQVVAVAAARPLGVMDEQVVDIGVETASAYQRRGYANIAVSALIDHFTRRGGEALYVCRPQHQASIATAQSVGCVAFGESLVMRAPII